jgi:chromosome segregation ATPase
MHYSTGKRINYVTEDVVSYDPNISPRSMSIRTTEKRSEAQDLVINQLQREIDDLSVREFDSENLQADIKELEDRIRGITDEINDQSAEYRIMREKTLMELARAQTRLRAQQKRHDDVENERSKYQRENADAELIMNNRHYKFVQTNDILKDATFAYQNVKNDFDKLKKNAQSVLEDRVQLRSEIESLEKLLEDHLINFKNLKEKVTKLETQLNSYTGIRDRIENDNDNLGRNQVDLEKKIDGIENHIFNMSIDLNNLVSEVQKSKNESYSLKNDIASLESKISKKKTSIAENEETIKDLTSKIDEDRATISKKEDFIGEMKTEEDSRQAIINEKRKESENYKLKIDLLKKFSLRAFDHMKEYVKLDKTVSEAFVRGYDQSIHGLGNENTINFACSVRNH